jgi:hypothetical protein
MEPVPLEETRELAISAPFLPPSVFSPPTLSSSYIRIQEGSCHPQKRLYHKPSQPAFGVEAGGTKTHDGKSVHSKATPSLNFFFITQSPTHCHVTVGKF